jgi:hypothetical protein
MIERIYIGLVLILMIILFYCLYAAWSHDTKTLQDYDNKINLINKCKKTTNRSQHKAILLELDEDFKKYEIPIDSKALYALEYKIKKNDIYKHKSSFKKIVNTCLFSIMQGGATGFITGGLPGLLGGSIVFGTVMPIISTYRDLNPVDEMLI